MRQSPEYSEGEATEEDLVTGGCIAIELFLVAHRVVRDDARCGFENVPGRAIILLEANHLAVRIEIREFEYVADLCAAP